MQLNTDRALSTDHLHWDVMKATFSEEASTCLFHGPYRLWDDSADEGVWLRNPRTGACRPFALAEVQRDREGDIQAWRFSGPSSLVLLIFND